MPSILTRPSGGGGAGGSVSVTAYSDAGLTTPITTANYGDTIYINAVASGLTPTQYSFSLTNGSKSQTFNQAGATLTYVVEQFGSVVVAASARDGSTGISVSATSTLTVGVVKNACAFDGVNDRTVGLAAIDGLSQSFSASLWVKINNSSAPQGIFSIEEPWNTNTTPYVFYGQAGSGGVGVDSIRIGAHTLETSTNNYGAITPDSNYHLLVVSYNYTTKDMNLYWDNALIKSIAGWDFNQPFILMYLGYCRNIAFIGIDYGNINVKDFRIHNAALDLATVQAMHADDTVMSGSEVQWFPFYEPIGTTTGEITDIIAGRKMKLQNMTSPFGIVAP